METHKTFGKQSDNIEVNSAMVSFTSSGTVIAPVWKDAKRAIPHSGRDSESIAILSPLSIPLSIKKLPKFLACLESSI